jgi:hypothetical protein
MNQYYPLKEGFLGKYQKQMINQVLPYQYDILNDALADVEKSHALENFRIAAGEAEGEFYGMVFQDSDVAKWLEAASYALAVSYDPKLDATVDETIRIVGKAQQADGYLNTYFTIKEPEHKWQNLQECHELYCAGHMIEAGVAHFEATGKTTLLDIVKKNADCICNRFGKGKVRGVSGHPEIELALMRLYHVTGTQAYLDTALYFINERGVEPEYIEEEAKNRGWIHFGMNPQDKEYPQVYAPVREQKDAVGHAVRAVYLYTGMADAARTCGDTSLLDACETLWQSITTKRMYVNGSIGSTGIGEAFTMDYDLPNDTNYSETCASVGLIFFGKQMLSASDVPDSKYSDVMERALYNTVLAGMSLNGKNFFYVNPLEANPYYDGTCATHKHVLAHRPSWYGCACCPPNVARLLTSLSNYLWTVKKDAVYSDLFAPGTLDLKKESGIVIETATNYPLEGTIQFQIATTAASTITTFGMRIPDWCRRYEIIVNDTAQNPPLHHGYATIKLVPGSTTTVTLKLDMTPQRIYANPKIREDAGCVAIMRGPLLYCIEGVDHNQDLSGILLKKDSPITELPYDDTLLDGIVPLQLEGVRIASSESLYTYSRPAATELKLHAIPYYAWDNRGTNEMKVWLHEL